MSKSEKETLWFPHDYEPTSDPKMQALIGDFGALGYGIYWRIVEMLHSDSEHKLKMKKWLFIAIANQMLPKGKQHDTLVKIVTPEYIESFIKTCANDYELFVIDDGVLWSERVLRNIEKKNKLSVIRSLSGSKGGKAKHSNSLANGKQNQANGKQSLADKRRGEEIRREESIKLDPNKALTNSYFLLLLGEQNPNGKLDQAIQTVWAAAAAETGYPKDFDIQGETVKIKNKLREDMISKPIPYIRKWLTNFKPDTTHGNRKENRITDFGKERADLLFGGSRRSSQKNNQD